MSNQSQNASVHLKSYTLPLRPTTRFATFHVSLLYMCWKCCWKWHRLLQMAPTFKKVNWCLHKFLITGLSPTHYHYANNSIHFLPCFFMAHVLEMLLEMASTVTDSADRLQKGNLRQVGTRLNRQMLSACS